MDFDALDCSDGGEDTSSPPFRRLLQTKEVFLTFKKCTESTNITFLYNGGPEFCMITCNHCDVLGLSFGKLVTSLFQASSRYIMA